MGGLNWKISQWTSVVWWNHRSRLEKLLSVIAVVSLVLCVITAAFLIVLISQMDAENVQEEKIISMERNQEQNTCLTSGCIKAAAQIMEYINENIDPCDDFYNFVCDNWLKKTMVPDDEAEVSAWTLLHKELQRRLRDIIENIENNAPPFMQNVKSLYDACMNITVIESLGSEPLETVLSKLGGWPVVNRKSNFDDFKWLETLKLTRKMGLGHNFFTSLSVATDIRNTSRYIIELDQPHLELDYTYLLQGLEDPVVSAYYQLMVDSAIRLGAKPDVAKEEMRDVLKFEIELANILVPREERRNVSQSYVKIKVHELKNIASEIEWESYLSEMLGKRILSDEDIIVGAPTYMKKMSLLLPRTNGKILQNYILWRVIHNAMLLLDKKWRDLSQNFSSVFTGEIRETDRWLQCVSSFSYRLSVAVGSLYARNYLRPDQRNQVSEIARYVSQAFLTNLESISWMDETTKRKAKAKAKNMMMQISYPDEILNDSEISIFYSDLHLKPTSHFENNIKLSKWYYDYRYSNLGKDKIRGDWKTWYIPSVNAYYSPPENALEIPGGVLQDFFHDSEKPKYLNYGAIGNFIGHEITHGFDDEGRQYDHVGNNFNWWEDETDKDFKERAQCMIYQYGNYTHEEIGMDINGVNSLGENIANNGGFKLAFWAYKQWVDDNGEEPRLPSLKYTPAQLFWISGVMGECAKQRPEYLRLQIMVDPHSPPYYSVIGSLTNLEEFSEEFNCPLGSPMNPTKKCIIW